MLSKKETDKRKQIKMLSIEDLVPAEHLLRKVENAIDFSFIHEEVKELYSLNNGRPSIDPVVLFKLCIINYMYGLNSMRRTVRECEVNMAYKWFLGYDMLESVPHFSTFGKNYARRFADTDIFEKIFSRILDEAINCKLVDTNVIYIDGTHIKANANTKKNIKVDKHLDGDPYSDPAYINKFREILKAVKNNYPIVIAYDSEKTGRSQRTYHPFKLSFSELNDKFRLLCAVFNTKTQKLNKITLNLGKIVSVKPSPLPYRATPEDLCKLFTEPCENPPITLEITKERNSLERFLLQFASFDRKTEYDPDRDTYTCQISYDMADETELLIRILSFGPTVKVLGPQSFLDQIKERLAKQMRLMTAATI